MTALPSLKDIKLFGVSEKKNVKIAGQRLFLPNDLETILCPYLVYEYFYSFLNTLLKFRPKSAVVFCEEKN